MNKAGFSLYILVGKLPPVFGPHWPRNPWTAAVCVFFFVLLKYFLFECFLLKYFLLKHFCTEFFLCRWGFTKRMRMYQVVFFADQIYRWARDGCFSTRLRRKVFSIFEYFWGGFFLLLQGFCVDLLIVLCLSVTWYHCFSYQSYVCFGWRCAANEWVLALNARRVDAE